MAQEPNESESEDEPYVPEEPPMAVKRERKQGSRGKGKGQAGSASGGVKEEAAEDPFRCKGEERPCCPVALPVLPPPSRPFLLLCLVD